MKAFHLAWQNILRNRRRSLVTILIATLGTASVLIAGGFALYTYGALIDGAAREFGHLTVTHPDYFQRDEETPLQYGLDDYAALATRFEADPRVKRALPKIALNGLVSNGDKSMIFMGVGTDLQAEAVVRGPFLNVIQGELPPGDDGTTTPKVLLGTDLAKSLNARPGSGLTLLATTTDGAMNAIDVEVAAIISTGWREIDKRIVYVSLNTAQHLLVTRKVATLSVYLDDTAQTPAVLADLSAQSPALGFKPWWEQAFYYHSVRALYNRIFGLLGIIIAALVFFSVANTLAMSVVERTREIGTLRALGALPGEIVHDFVREGSLIGGIASVLGMLLAIIVSLALAVSDLQMPPPPGRSEGYPLQVDIEPTLYAITVVAIVSLCALAAWFASRKAVEKPIVEALGHV